MYTGFVLFALTGFAPLANESELSWLTSYPAARQQGNMEKKPIAIFLGTGQNGWSKLVRGGSLSKEQQDILASRYVCLYVDTATEEGKRLARSLQIQTPLGLVISDSTGNWMAFHEGDLAAQDMTRYLTRFGDPNRVMYRTETNPSHPTETRSYYPPSAPVSWPSTFRGGNC
jgi:hypothetical protein